MKSIHSVLILLVVALPIISAHVIGDFCKEFKNVCQEVCPGNPVDNVCYFAADEFLGYKKKCTCAPSKDVTPSIVKSILNHIDTAKERDASSDPSGASGNPSKTVYYYPRCKPKNVTAFCSDFKTLCLAACSAKDQKVSRNSCRKSNNKVGYKVGCKCGGDGHTREVLSNVFSITKPCSKKKPDQPGGSSVDNGNASCKAKFKITWDDKHRGFGLSLQVSSASSSPQKPWSVRFSFPNNSYQIDSSWNVKLEKGGDKFTATSEPWISNKFEKAAGFGVVGTPAVLPIIESVQC